MALTDRVEINIANNAELRANAQYVFALTRAARPKNMSLAYDLKQKEFKVRRMQYLPPPFLSSLLLNVLCPMADILFGSRPSVNRNSIIIVILLQRISYFFYY